MKRLDILDGFRGYFLVFMMVNHLTLQGGSIISVLNHSSLGYVQDAQGFVFISGLIVGLYYAKGYLKGRSLEMDTKIYARAGLLYRYSLVLLGLLFVLPLVFPTFAAPWERFYADFFRDPLTIGMGALILLYQPTYMDILPQYILYLLLTPFLIRLALNGKGVQVLGGSIAVWLLTQIGAHTLVITAIEEAGQSVAPAFITRAGFNPMGWQLLFVSGLVIGAGLTKGTLKIGDWFDASRPGPALTSLALVVYFMVVRLGFTFGYLPDHVVQAFRMLDHRTTFSLIYPINFLALGYLVSWLIICGPQATSRVAQKAGWLLKGLFMLEFLRFLGRHSLQVYAFHLVLVFAMYFVDFYTEEFNEVAKTGIVLSAIALLAVPAWLHEQKQKAKTAQRAAART
ncbi:hypothetical protein CKO38_04080 [Rhodospirillum rubrum]|uniref:OpgC family protein n=1 Tax=Rhodospirillum rubrum TaxID=1085 RepID=UPI001904E0D2|nr:OpgC domain-containing protein [Rhodospirillum rubrum]MBK1663797.1 hypothetical protein [Rhodospirillum rubrum]MBK1675864.1 hypothetical protein [Rhodospirillum rubrum]